MVRIRPVLSHFKSAAIYIVKPNYFVYFRTQRRYKKVQILKTVHHPIYGKITVDEATSILRTEYGERDKIERRISVLETLIAEAR